jgi:hypothetical protein
MPANTTPIFTKIGDVQWISGITTANTSTDLTTGTSYLAFTADATNGGYVQKVRFRAVTGTGNNNVATVARVWINNGATTGTATNNILFDEISLAATTGSATSALAVYELPLNVALPAGYKLYITLGTTVAAGYYATVVGGKY